MGHTALKGHRKGWVEVAQRHCPRIDESDMGRTGCLRIELSSEFMSKGDLFSFTQETWGFVAFPHIGLYSNLRPNG